MADRTRVNDKSSLRRCRIEIPNLIDDMGLSVYEFRLYVHLKRVAEDEGSCWQSTRTLATACNMSMGQVSKAKDELEQRGLIERQTKSVRGGLADDITIVDIWPDNFKHYAAESGAKAESVHHTNTLSSKRSPHERLDESVHTVNASAESVHHTNTLSSKRSPGETKNHDQYHIEINTNSPPPTMHDPQKNGAAAPGDGGGDFYKELRRRKVGQAKAREIEDRYSEQPERDRILRLIDQSDSAHLGRTILDILDGVIDAPPARAQNGPSTGSGGAAPLAATRPNMPETTVPTAELARRARERHAPS